LGVEVFRIGDLASCLTVLDSFEFPNPKQQKKKKKKILAIAQKNARLFDFLSKN